MYVLFHFYCYLEFTNFFMNTLYLCHVCYQTTFNLFTICCLPHTIINWFWCSLLLCLGAEPCTIYLYCSSEWEERNMKDYYHILEIQVHASEEDIKRAYK